VSSLPAWLDPLPDAARQRAADEWAIEQQHVPSLDLMERAGTGLTRLVEEVVPDGPIAVVVGKGNNGGDGLVAARLLREAGRDVDVLAVGAVDELRGDPRANLERLPGDPPRPFAPEALDRCAGAVDALLGTGFSGEPRDPIKSAIEALDARAGLAVVAVDVPSGVDASTGEVHGAAVHARATATFHRAKPGLWIAPGKEHAGRVRVVDIGIPPGAPEEAEIGLIEPVALSAVPSRGAGSTKFSEGAVLVVGGSPGLTGAPSMSSESAQRTGAGYVTACVPRSVNYVFELRLLEAMSVPLPDDDGALGPTAVEPVLERAQRADAMVLGPGLGRADASLEFARTVAREVELPLLLDADGLNAHVGRLEDLAARAAPTVLTPHAGELARLLEIDSAAVGARRLHHARDAARRCQAVVLLKGDDTLIAIPEGQVGVSRGGSGGLATAGTGDVLSGVIGALLAKRLHPMHAACAGALLHATAGQVAGERFGVDVMIARDVIEALPEARRRLRP
jgi:ADP-dependent NAD(P)H-hydrate dehydratase / NAD(P)H-hydrate epimerase